MNVSLAPELEQFVNAKISASEVISTALRMMNEQEHFTNLESEIDMGWEKDKVEILMDITRKTKSTAADCQTTLRYTCRVLRHSKEKYDYVALSS